MTQEYQDFAYFRDNQLHSIDFSTGIINAKKQGVNLIFHNVGSLNPDGYERVWCNRKLRMKHRLVYFLYHGELPTIGEEIDHYDSIRSNNAISNLRILTKSENNTGCSNRKIPRYTQDLIHKICAELSGTDMADQSIADKFDVSRATVRDIKTRRSRQKISQHYSWDHRGY